MKNLIFRKIFVAVVLPLVPYAFSEPASGYPGADGGTGDGEGRPKIGLVLGGGGAKGAAHVGVLQVLDELRIPVDCVAGTSMGALVGGIFATGTPPDEIEQAMQAIDWKEVVGGQGFRDRIPIEDKIANLGNSNSFELGIGKDGLETSTGFIRTQEIEDVIRGLVSHGRYAASFDDLPIPYRAVATDMVNETRMVLDGGDLAVAMRASMAIPGVFSPVEWNGTLLSDGGLLNNLPVDVARELCADAVIAVSMDSEPPTRDDLDGALSMISRSLDVVINANERASIASLGPADVGIAINTRDITSGDFLRMAEAIEIGRAAANDQRAELSRFSVPEEDYAAWKAGLRTAPGPEPVLAGVDIVGLQRVDRGYVESLIRHSRAGEPVDEPMITADVERIYAAGDFERVEYRLVGAGNNPALEIRPVEKRWGPNFLHLDYGLASDFGGDLQAMLRLDHSRTWVNRRGGRWSNTAQLGQRTIVATNFYQPIDIAQRFFVDAAIRYENSLEGVYIDGERVARYYFRETFGQMDVGFNIDTRAQIRAGIRQSQFAADRETGFPGLPEINNDDDTSIQASLVYDTRDNVGLATQGWFVSARYRHGEDWFGGDQDYKLFEAVVTRAFEFHGNSLHLIAAGADSDGDVPPNFSIRLGGIRTFPGLRQYELRGPRYWVGGVTYLQELAEVQPLFGQSIYAGLRLTAGEMSDRFDGIDDGVLLGIAASLQGRTPIGSFLLSVGYVDNDAFRLQFSLGRPLDEGSLLDEAY